MNQVKLAALVLGLLSIIEQPAEAGPKPKVDFLCGIYANNAIKDVLPSSTNPKIDQSVACVVHLADPGPTTYAATITTLRHLVNPSTDDRTEITGDAARGMISHKAGTEGDDLEVIMEPGKQNANGDILFESCEAFDITAEVKDKGTVVFSKTIKIVQSCPKAKIKAPSPPPAAKPQPQPSSASEFDELFSFQDAASWKAYSFETGGAGPVYVIGSCFNPGTVRKCIGSVITKQNKLVKALDVDIEADSGSNVDQGKLRGARSQLAKLVGNHQGGNAMSEHVLGAAPYVWTPVTFKWAANKGTLTVLDGKKTFKTVNLTKVIPKANKISAVAVYLFEAGSPPAAIVRITYAFSSAEVDAIEDSYMFITVPLPAIDNG